MAVGGGSTGDHAISAALNTAPQRTSKEAPPPAPPQGHSGIYNGAADR